VPHAELGDHVHASAYNNDSESFEPTTGPDLESIYHNCDNESVAHTMVSMSDAAACFSLILEWILKTGSLQLAGARAAALACYLDPVNNNRFGSTLSQIAEQASCTRAALSKALLDFRDSAGIHLSMGKLSGSRQKYRDTQIKCLEAGRHSSQVRRKKETAEA
jgi:hypothetical protein